MKKYTTKVCKVDKSKTTMGKKGGRMSPYHKKRVIQGYKMGCVA